MKKIYLLFAVFILMSYSCELLEDANTIDIDSSISMNIPVAISAPSAISLKSTTASYPFSKSGTASLSDDEDLEEYLDRIRSIDIEDVRVNFYGIQAGQVVETISLSVSGVGEIATITNVSSTNTTHNPTISSSKLEQIANNLEENWQISATVAGSTNAAPMSFSVSTEFDIVVKAKAL